MATFEDHCAVDRRHLGKEYPEVHRWLDEFFRVDGFLHRRHRHHKEGVDEVRKRWGAAAAKAAILHIILDMGHVPAEEDWRNGFVMDATGNRDLLDEFGRRESYLKRHSSHDRHYDAVAWCKVLRCGECGRTGEHRLVDPAKGRFLCPHCDTESVDPKYRMDPG